MTMKNCYPLLKQNQLQISLLSIEKSISMAKLLKGADSQSGIVAMDMRWCFNLPSMRSS